MIVAGSSSGTPDASIVIATRDRASRLSDCLRSIGEQEYPRGLLEVVVVDDGSKDNTPRVVGSAARQLAPLAVRYVRLPGRGQNAARNAGLHEATGDLIAFLDDDEIPTTRWIRALVRASRRNPDAGCFGGAIRMRVEGPIPRSCGRCFIVDVDRDMGPEERSVEEVGGGNMALRRSAVAQAGPFDTRLRGWGNETEWMFRFTRMGGRIVYVPDAAVEHRTSASQVRIWRLVSRSFLRGWQGVHADTVSGWDTPVGPGAPFGWQLARIPRLIGHAVLRRCPGGLITAAWFAGGALGALASHADTSRTKGCRDRSRP